MYGGWENFANIALYLEMVQHRPILWNINRKLQVAYQAVLVPMTLSDLEGWNVNRHLLNDLLNYAPTV